MIISPIRNLILVVVLISADEIDLFAQQSYKRGVYLSVEEFLNNEPSGPTDFNIIEGSELTVARSKNTSELTVSGSRQLISLYRLKDAKGKNFKGFRDFWGFSDGYYVYVNSATHIKADHFVRVQETGAICYFLQMGNDSGLKPILEDTRGLANQFYPRVEPVIYNLEQFVIERKSGEISKLTKEKLLQIVSPYPDLVQLADQRHKREIFVDLIRLYNQKAKL